MKKVNLGGDRIGSGNKMNIAMHGYERSTHDLSSIWKSTMSAGTLVPFLNMVSLPGDSIDINLDSIVKTHPTIGPLFGSFKLQLDVFSIPMRLYNKILHNNQLGLGMNMAQVKFPTIELTAANLVENNTPYEFQQINQSSLLAYLGIRGLGNSDTGTPTGITTTKNAIPILGYWDIVKNYYANKQEENAYVIHGQIPSITTLTIDGATKLPGDYTPATQYAVIRITGINLSFDNVQIQTSGSGWLTLREMALSQSSIITITEGKNIELWFIKEELVGQTFTAKRIDPDKKFTDMAPSLKEFPLENIDGMRESILAWPSTEPLVLNTTSYEPYSLQITTIPGETHKMYSLCGQEGLAVKTYQSDMFNNWIQEEWIEGAGSISAITAISTDSGSFTLDTLNLSKKVYDMLNRIAVSGGSYEDWLESVYDHNSKWRAESPVYQGGLSKEITFQEVISNAATAEEPLGTLAGKGIMGHKHKGGHVVINTDEPSFIMGIVSITPRISYSQGNDWYTNLTTMDDLHKPALDGIGFQDLVTDQMAYWDTYYTNGVPNFKSAGKQPAWLNYMSNIDRNYANFADPRTQLFMTLDRRYQPSDPEGGLDIADLTTYIDPAKFNYAFAQVDLSAQNFWVQVAMDITARRKISAKIIPNL